MSLLSRDSILSANDRTTKDVEVPEWGGTVRVQSLSGRERDKFESSMIKMRGNKREENLENLRARLCVLCMVDESGQRMFNDKEDVIKLGNKSAKALQRVFDAAQEINGMTESDVEEMTEGFEEAPGED